MRACGLGLRECGACKHVSVWLVNALLRRHAQTVLHNTIIHYTRLYSTTVHYTLFDVLHYVNVALRWM